MKAILAAGAAALCLVAALVLVTSDADARLVPAALLGKTQFLAGGLEVIDKKQGSGDAATAGKTVKVIDGTHVLARTHARTRLLTQSRSFAPPPPPPRTCRSSTAASSTTARSSTRATSRSPWARVTSSRGGTWALPA